MKGPHQRLIEKKTKTDKDRKKKNVERREGE